MPVAPSSLAPALLSKDAAARRAALAQLDLELGSDDEPKEVRLLAVNVDADPELELLALVEGTSSAQAALFDEREGTWYQHSLYVCCGPGHRGREPFVELHQLVWHGTYDLVLYSGGSQGTGVSERRLQVFRLRDGQLYSVLDVATSVINWTSAEEARFTFPDPESSSEPRRILARRTRETFDLYHRRTSRRTSCEVYQWDPQRFLFAPLPVQSKNGC